MPNTNNNIHIIAQYFSNPTHPITISLIGCGGTGSLLIPRIARLDHYLKAKGLPGIHLSAYDDDCFELKNVGRQQCTPFDVGRNKAFSTIEKVNLAYGLQWEAFDYRALQMPKNNLIITAIDNIDMRNLIHTRIANIRKRKQRIKPNEIDYKTPLYWLDTGNGKDFGQVVLATINTLKKQSLLPTVIDLFGPLENSDSLEAQQTISCSQTPISETQDLFVNDAIAVDAIQMIQNLLTKPALNYQGMVSNRSAFVSKGLPITA